MAVPSAGYLGKITSWGSSGDDCYQLVTNGFSPYKYELKVSAQPLDITSYGSSGVVSRAYTAQLGTWEVAISGRFPKATPKLGNQGLVSVGGSALALVQGWTLNMSWATFDITAQAASGPTWRSMRPGILLASGTVDLQLDSGAAATLPAVAGAASSAFVLKLTEDGTNDNSFTFNGRLNDLGISSSVDGMNLGKYGFQSTGDITCIGSSTTSNILPCSTTGVVVDIPDWDNDGDGVPDRSLVFQSDSGRTYTGAAFLKSLSITCRVDQVIEVVATAQGCGALTVA